MSDCTSNDFAIMKFRFMARLAAWTMFGFFLYIFSITFGIVPKENLPSVNTILGFLILEIGIMIGYYFGASQSSSSRQQKDEEQDPIEAKAKAEAARIEEARIKAAKEEAERKETTRLEVAKAEAAKVIDAAKADVTADQKKEV